MTTMIVEYLPQRRINDQTILRLASSTAFVRGDVRVYDLFEAMNDSPDLQAVGVVDKAEAVVGIVVRRNFMAMMARPYAQDVFRNHPVREIMEEATTYSSDSNAFSVAEEIAEDMRRPGATHYLLTWSGNRFAGVFSSQDMLVYLSQITQADIELARRLQSRIVRDREIIVGNRLELVASSRTAKGVGGDFYKVTQYAPGKWIIAMCDVSGKGIAASIITSALWGMMSIYDFRAGLSSFVRQVNNYLVQTFETEKFVTAVFLEYDESTRRVDVCDLGHSHLFLFRDGSLRKVKTNQKNLPLGIMADMEPRIDTFRPATTDIFFLITDGLIEQQNLAGEEYTLTRIGELFVREADRPVEVISDRLFDDFTSFRGKRPLTDDVTWALVRFAEQEITL
jgi:sigma-B regulation protein RsbU (phosphoserine phosphatase)